MKKTLSLFFVMAALLLGLTGCSSYSLVNSESYVGENIRSFHTFRIVTPKEGNLPPGMTMVSYYNIAAAIREQMVERGFTEDPESPLLVNIGLTVNKDLVNVPYSQTIQTGPALPPPPPPAPPRPLPGRPGVPPGHGPAMNGVVPVFMYPRAYYWPNYTTVTQWVPTIYKEGVLTMDLVDTASEKPVYTSSVATILDNGDSQLQTLSGITKAVQVLFSEFPIPLPKK
ncbi:MAG: DUF4136 domain-containing protein [Muribaculaceae bacterium]|nr:DUF4136 domain-containing protein [Muribaculaceae bacterium]